jgi:hypothetical protein
MATYIDKDALLHKMQERHEDLARDYGDYDNYVTGFGDAIEFLENASTVDVQEVKHGKWLHDKKREGIVICSECKLGECCDWFRYKYCYSCGAKMDLEDE